jgi:transposase
MIYNGFWVMKMGLTYKISDEEAKAIREKMKVTKNTTAYRRMEAVALLGEGKTPDEVSAIKKYNSRYVRNLGRSYHEKGLEAFGVDGRRGGNHRIMCEEESAEFIRQFEEQAQKGTILTVSEIAKALDEKTGKERKSLSTAYSLLHRHKWRKVMPRSKHPNKASDEAIEASKKLTLGSAN